MHVWVAKFGLIYSHGFTSISLSLLYFFVEKHEIMENEEKLVKKMI
jgi:hypothetical protein